MGTQRIPEKGTEPPFSANVYCGKTAGCIRIQLGTEVGLGPGEIVLDGDPPSSPLKGAHPLFSTTFIVPNGWMNQDAAAYGGSPQPRPIALDGDPAAPTKNRAQPPIIGPYLLWPNGWMDQDATSYGGRPRPRPHCFRWGPSSPKRGTAPNFRPMSVVAKRSSISATAEHLL